MNTKIEFGFADHAPLLTAPINADWILEGKPVARNALLSRSDDGDAFTVIWDCTSGAFEWRYSIDETVYILEGSVIVEDEAGGIRRLEAGATVFFPPTVIEPNGASNLMFARSRSAADRPIEAMPSPKESPRRRCARLDCAIPAARPVSRCSPRKAGISRAA